MANRDFMSARGARLRDTVRISVAESERARVTETYLFSQVLFGQLEFGARDFLCAQDFSRFGFFDITFRSTELCRKFHAQFQVHASHPKLKGLQPEYLFVEEEVLLTLHFFNPFVRDDDIMAFLQKYCSNVRFIRKLVNSYNVWNGKRQYVVRFKRDDACYGGLRQPPAVFSIGADKGRVYFRNQPQFCRSCLRYGHFATECTQTSCTKCGSTDHTVKKCPIKKCDLCNAENHLFRDCPKRQRSYAEAAGRYQDKREASAALVPEDIPNVVVLSKDRGAESGGEDGKNPTVVLDDPVLTGTSEGPEGEFSNKDKLMLPKRGDDPKPQRKREAEGSRRLVQGDAPRDGESESCLVEQIEAPMANMVPPESVAVVTQCLDVASSMVVAERAPFYTSLSDIQPGQQSIWEYEADPTGADNSGAEALLAVIMDTSESSKRSLDDEEREEEPDAKKLISDNRTTVSEPGGMLESPFSPVISSDGQMQVESDVSDNESISSDISGLEIKRCKP